MSADGHSHGQGRRHADDHGHAHGGHAHGGHAHGGHAHGGHGHHHPAPGSYGTAFAVGIALNLIFVLVEAGFGFVAHSVALIADAGHNLSDVLGLVIAWGAWALGRRAPTERFTYGLRGSSILAALANGLLLLFACGAIALEAVQRLAAPAPVMGRTVMIVAAVGILVNLATALLLARGREGDLNLRAAFVHMLADAAVSLGVVIAGLLTLLTHAAWIDPATSLVIVAVILWSGWGLLKEALAMAMQGVPAGIEPQAVAARLGAVAGVTRVHHLHIWAMSTTETALTAHLVMPSGHPGDAFLRDVSHAMEHDFAIRHTTFQVETGVGEQDCAVAKTC